MNLQTKTFLIAIFACAYFLLSVHQVDAQKMPRNPLPDDERKLRDELERDSSITPTPCGWFEMPQNADPKLLEFQRLNNQAKLSLYKAALTKTDVVKVKKLCSTDEGTIISFYMLVEKGKMTLINDYSRDAFSSGRFYSTTCESLSLGKYALTKDDKRNRQEFQPATEKENELFVLRCEKPQSNSPTEKIF